MADIFISYCSSDRDRIEQIVAALEEEGFSVWWDTHIDLGDTYDEVIEEELGAGKAAIVVWSSSSRKSRWVRSEAQVAERLGKLVPIQIDPNARPIAFELVQTEDFIDWDGDRNAQCWKRLLIKLIAMVGEPENLTASPAASNDAPIDRPDRAVPNDRQDGGGVLTAVLTAIFGGAFLGALISGSVLMAGGFALAGIFFWLFRLADTELPVQIKALASRWLLPRQSGVHVSVAEAFNSLFEAVFTPRHWTVRCLWRSAMASGFFFLAFFCFAYSFVPPVQAAMNNEWGATLRNLIFVFFIANIIGDYVSLFQTRIFLRWSVTMPAAILPLALLDAVMTLIIYLAVLYGVDNGWRFTMDLLASSDVVEATVEQARTAVEQSAKEDAGGRPGFTWPSPYDYFNALIPQLFDPQNNSPLWARSWVLIFSVMTTFITSVWLWLVLIVGPLAKLTMTNRGEASFFGRMARVEKLPFTVVGMIVAASVSLLTFAVSQFWLPVAQNPDASIVRSPEDDQAWRLAKDLNTIEAFTTYLEEHPEGFYRKDAEASIAGLEDEAAWKTAQETNTAKGYADYLETQPAGSFRDAAQNAIAKLRDEGAWANAQEENTVVAYKAYLDDHPQGAFRQAAQAAIDDIEQEARARAQAAAADLAAWNQAQDVDSIAAYEAYLTRYPSGDFVNSAKARLVVLNDNAAWAKAQEQNTVSAFEDYLDAYPAGQFADTARARIATLKDDAAWGLASRTNTIDGYQAYLRDYPEGASAKRARDAIATLEEAETRQSSQFAVGSSFRDCTECPEMVVLPSGSFLMGSPESEAGRDNDEGPQRRVTIGYKLAVGKFEITWREWEACVAAGGCNGSGPEGAGGDNGWGKGSRPVIEVSWNDAKSYVQWLSKKTGEPYRLLSEAEWEYAARAGTTTRYAFGDTITTKQANFRGDTYLEQTVPVGSYRPNAWGLYDMHGNVWEWVEDCYQESYAGLPVNGSAFTNCSSGAIRVARGGSWYDDPRNLRSADRSRSYPASRFNAVGFRVARTLP